MVVKKRRNRKNCLYYCHKTNGYRRSGLTCFSKLKTWFCKGVNCGCYKEKQ